MKLVLKGLKWFDDNFLHLLLILYIFAVSLVPKLPLFHVEYTYIKIRYDDFFLIPISLVFLFDVLRKKISFRKNFLVLILLFWAAVFTSFIVGAYFQDTIPVDMQGLLHSLRRVEYMLIFFIASSVITSKKRFFTYMKIFLFVVLLVNLYGFGQKFFHLPSIQSMNPAYVDGRLLILKPEDRINSTFGGHFDLGGYLIFAIPLMISFHYFLKQKRYVTLYILTIMVLLYTAARSSFVAFVVATTAFLLYFRKFWFFLFSIILVAGLIFLTGDEITKRFQQTVQVKTVFVNVETGLTVIDQKITTKELPAGSLNLPFFKVLPFKTISTTDRRSNKKRLEEIAFSQALEEARIASEPATNIEIERKASEIAKVLRPQKRLLCDISCATRLQVEWPRAIAAFLYNPIVGSGPYSLKEATDNSFLRWLGEFGLVGTTIFVILLYKISKFIISAAKKSEPKMKIVYYSYIFGFLALLINALYVDIFEASKVAYNFWLVTGFYVGLADIEKKQKV